MAIADGKRAAFRRDPDASRASDTGHAGIWTGSMVELRHSGQRYIRCAGSMGWGLPGAIGVKFAVPDRPVVCFTGDGALYYHLPELETAVRHGVKLIVVVNDNAALSQEMPGVVRAYGNQLRGRGSEMFAFEKTDFAEVARSFGCIGLKATTPVEFRDAFRTALAADRCVVIDALTDLQAMAQKPWA
jgi:acetolactate synthase I/II/III large subunit